MFLNKLLIKKISLFFDKIYIPFLKVSIKELFKIYVMGIFDSKILKQATGISWIFFMSIFPFTLFLLSMLPHLPHYDSLKTYIFDVLVAHIFPLNMKNDVVNYLQNTVLANIENMSQFTIFGALVFATRGTIVLINGFNHGKEKRKWYWEYLFSFLITLSFAVVILLGLFGVYYSQIVFKLLSPKSEENFWFSDVIDFISLMTFPLFYIFILSLFYWFGCFKIKKWKSTIPGAVFTTLLFILVTYFFTLYVRKFANYNVLYGSVGSILLLMVWINLNVILILLGNEFNIAIDKIKNKRE